MKKLMTALAVCAAATISMAQSVPSANVVGYASTSIPNGFTMIAFNFAAVGGGTNTLGGTISGSTADGDELWLKNGSGWKLYGFDHLAGGWVDGDTLDLANDVPVPCGTAMWYHKTSGAGNITFSGEVGQNSASIQFPVGFKQIGSCSPVAFSPNDATHITWIGLTDGCEILKKSGSSWKLYSYDHLGGGWVDGDTLDVATTTLNVGEGGWFHNTSSGTITMTQTNPLN